jgi:hypothetical protein
MRFARATLLCAVLSACGTTGGKGVVIPYENGRFVSTASARAEQDALRDALAAAKDECRERRQPLSVVKQKTEYKGVVAREVVKTAEQIEEILAAGGGKVIPDLATDEDYQVSIEFRCGG